MNCRPWTLTDSGPVRECLSFFFHPSVTTFFLLVVWVSFWTVASAWRTCWKSRADLVAVLLTQLWLSASSPPGRVRTRRTSAGNGPTVTDSRGRSRGKVVSQSQRESPPHHPPLPRPFLNPNILIEGFSLKCMMTNNAVNKPLQRCESIYTCICKSYKHL